MPRHVVRPGECAASIAALHGTDGRTLMDLPGNAALKQKRRSRHILNPGDIVEVPARREHPLRVGEVNAFRAPLEKVALNVQVLDEEGRPARGKRFRLVVEEDTTEGETDGAGALSARVSARATRGRLRVWLAEDRPPVDVVLAIGHLDPETETTGVRQRLGNLGYPIIDGKRSLAEALREFQRAEELPETGVADDETIARLVKVHGC